MTLTCFDLLWIANPQQLMSLRKSFAVAPALLISETVPRAEHFETFNGLVISRATALVTNCPIGGESVRSLQSVATMVFITSIYSPCTAR